MKRRLGLSLILAGLVAGGAADRSPGAAKRHRPAAHMLVIAQEWSLTLSRGRVPAGRLSVQLYDRGQDAHNLNIRRWRHGGPMGSRQRVALTQSGAISQARWHLVPGRYVLFCSLPAHEHRGMKAFLTVR